MTPTQPLRPTSAIVKGDINGNQHALSTVRRGELGHVGQHTSPLRNPSGRRRSRDRVARRHQAVHHPRRLRLHRHQGHGPQGRARAVHRYRRPDRMRKIHLAHPHLRARTSDRRHGRSARPGGQEHHPRRRLHVPDGRDPSMEDGPRQRRHGPAVPRHGEATRRSEGEGLDPPGRPRRLRGSIPPSALRRHAQARRPGTEPHQRARDTPHGRTVQRPRRADEGDHVE
jgi:hypothetical protein